MTAPLATFDLDEIAFVREDNRWAHTGNHYFVHPRSGELFHWDEDHLLNGEGPVEEEDLDPDLVVLDWVDSGEAYRDMQDFVSCLTDRTAADRLQRALDDRGPFRRFRDTMMRSHPELSAPWRSFEQVRSHRRSVHWLMREGLVDREEAEAYIDAHPDPDVP